jgi:hypothetical protein
MNPTETSFPRRDLTGTGHQQIRDLLVREAVPGVRSRSSRLRVAVPATGLAVAVVIGGVVAVTGSWGTPAGVADPAAPLGGGMSHCSVYRRAPATVGDGYRYLLPSVPAGWTYTSDLQQHRYCVEGSKEFVGNDEVLGTDPVVGFVKQQAGGTVTAVLTVFRSLAPFTGPDQEGVANGTARNPASSAVTVRSRPGRLIRKDTLTWVEPDGQRWSVSSNGVSVAELTAFVDGLVLRGRSVAQPDALGKGYERLTIPRLVAPKTNSWQYEWWVDYTLGTGTLGLGVTQGGGPWQARLPSLARESGPVRLVEVAGRPGVVLNEDAKDSTMLFTTVANGAQLFLKGTFPAKTGPVELVEQLKSVPPGDPLIHAPAPLGK